MTIRANGDVTGSTLSVLPSRDTAIEGQYILVLISQSTNPENTEGTLVTHSWTLAIENPCHTATFPQSDNLDFKINVGVGQARDELFSSEHRCGSIASTLDCNCGQTLFAFIDPRS